MPNGKEKTKKVTGDDDAKRIKREKDKTRKRQKKVEALDKKLRAWLDHPRHKRTFRRNKAFGVRLPSGTEVMWQGIHARLKQCLWPHDEEDPWLKDRNERIRRSSAPVAVNYKSRQPSTCKTSGKKHGEICHEQVEEWCKCVVTHHGKLAEGTKMFLEHRQKEGYDLCVERVIRLCLKENWIPVDAERIIWDEDMKLNTAIDLVVVDYILLRLIVIELKFAYEGEVWDAHPTDARLPSPFGKLRKCPAVKAQLQLTASYAIVKRKYKITFDAGYVVRPMPRARETGKYGLMNYFKTPMGGGKKKTNGENTGKQNLENLYNLLCGTR